MRARDLGISIGQLRPGPRNAITDIEGVRVGHTTIIEGAPGPLVVGQGPVRTGVTVVVPVAGDPFRWGVFAGAHRLNGNGELTGLEWIREAGLLSGPIAITNTHSVGVVRDAIVAAAARSRAGSRLLGSWAGRGRAGGGSTITSSGWRLSSSRSASLSSAFSMMLIGTAARAARACPRC